jgi:aspartate-semialdehyde dehydrogenase
VALGLAAEVNFYGNVAASVAMNMAVTVEFERPISVADARAALKNAPGVSVVDHRVDEGYVTPQEAAGEDPVFVSRIRKDPTVRNGLSMWVVADNLRKGAALNAVQIAEILIRDHLRAGAGGGQRQRARSGAG